MAHECPNCGQECYCDGEDHHQDAPAGCSHNCGGAWLDGFQCAAALYSGLPGYEELRDKFLARKH